MAQVDVIEVVPFAVMVPNCPAPSPRVIIIVAPTHWLAVHALVLSFSTEVDPGVTDEAMPRSPLIKHLGPVLPAAVSSTAYSACPNRKKCQLRMVLAGAARKKKLYVLAVQVPVVTALMDVLFVAALELYPISQYDPGVPAEEFQISIHALDAEVKATADVNVAFHTADMCSSTDVELSRVDNSVVPG